MSEKLNLRVQRATKKAAGIRLRNARRPRLSINPLGGVGGPQPSDCNPNPATCAVGSEALQGSPAAPKAQVNPVSSEKIAQRAFSTA